MLNLRMPSCTALLVLFSAVCLPGSAFAEMSCTDCHDVLDKEYIHEPAVADCTICHFEHDLDTTPSKKLRAPVTELCLSCHQKTVLGMDGGHPVAASAAVGSGAGHPYWIERDPMWDDGDLEKYVPEFNCTNCHNPHSSAMPALFPWNYMKKPFDGNLCAPCHKDIAYGAYVPPKPEYDSPRLPPKRGAKPPQRDDCRWWEYLIGADGCY